MHGDDPAANPDSPTFAAVIGNTSLPHVLEHLIIDEQVRDAETSRPNSARSESERLAVPAPPAAPFPPARAPSFSALSNPTSPAPAPSDPIPARPAPIPSVAPFTDVTFVGTTEWLDEAAGLARVEVNFTDDLVALRALRSALAFLNEVLDGKAV